MFYAATKYAIFNKCIGCCTQRKKARDAFSVLFVTCSFNFVTYVPTLLTHVKNTRVITQITVFMVECWNKKLTKI